MNRIVIHVGSIALVALMWVPETRAQEGPSQTTQNSQALEPSSREAPAWLVPVPKTGTPVRITDRSGQSTTGRLAAVLPYSLRLVADGVTVELPLADIALVQRNGDSLWNGAAWGAGMLGLVSLGANADCDNCISAGERMAFVLTLAGIGAGVGALLDLLVSDKRILYRAPTRTSVLQRMAIQPVLTGESRGLRLSWDW